MNDEEMRVIWNALGLYISRNLRMGRGVNIPKLGIFTFTPPEVRLKVYLSQPRESQISKSETSNQGHQSSSSRKISWKVSHSEQQSSITNNSAQVWDHIVPSEQQGKCLSQKWILSRCHLTPTCPKMQQNSASIALSNILARNCTAYVHILS